jgi:nickel-dependent lactate racemase
MVVKIHYGNEELDLNLPDHIAFDEYKPMPVDNMVDFNTFREELIPAEERLFSIRKADLFIINDAYRPTPTCKTLEWLEKLGKLNNEARFLIATGCHKMPDEYQMKNILGSLYPRLRNRVMAHDARDLKDMIEVGTDSFEQPVFINKHFYGAKNIVVIGSVEPHYFAGFTGGRKSIFPGLCDFNTTARNHNLAVSFSAVPLKLEGNPVEEHLQSLMQLIPAKNIFSIQLVLSDNNAIASIFCGDLNTTFNSACEFSARIYTIKIEKKSDLLLAEVRPPLDSNLYQLQKSLENCQPAVADSGTIILFSPCLEGIGSDNFYKLAGRWKPDETLEPRDSNSFGLHKLYRVYKIRQRIKVALFSELPDDVPERVFFTAIRKPQPIIDDMVKEKKELNVSLVRDSGHIVLISR